MHHYAFNGYKTVQPLYLEIGDSAMRRKWEAGEPIVSQIVPDFVSDLGFAVTYDKQESSCC